MAYIYISNAAFPTNTYYLKANKPLDAKYNVQYISDLWTSVPSSLYIPKYNIDHIPEGQQIYITNGSKCGDVETASHKGEIWVLIDKLHITKPIFEYNLETGIETKTEGPHGWRLLGQESHGLNWEQL